MDRACYPQKALFQVIIVKMFMLGWLATGMLLWFLLKDVLKTIVHTYTAVLVVGWWLWVDKKEIAIFPSDIIFHS